MSRRLAGAHDRRTFLKMLAAVGGLGAVPLLEPCSSAAQSPTTQPSKVVGMRVGHVNPADHWMTELLKRWADGVARRTGGGIKIDVHPGGVLGTGRTSAEGVAMGTIEAHFNDPSEYAFFNQALNILSAPFIWVDRNQLQKAVRDPGILNTLYDSVIKKGIRPLALGYSGTRNVTTRNTPAKKPEDLKGLKIRVPEIPVYRDMVAAWGATPTPIPAAEIFTSLQAGVVDGQENPLAQIIAMRLYEVQKYVILTTHITQTGSIIMNEKLFRDQPKEYQKALVDAAQEAMDWAFDYINAQDDKFLTQVKGFGVDVVEPDRQAFRDAMKPLYEKYDNIWTKELREKIQSYK